jgi:hypothetical protein
MNQLAFMYNEQIYAEAQLIHFNIIWGLKYWTHKNQTFSPVYSWYANIFMIEMLWLVIIS